MKGNKYGEYAKDGAAGGCDAQQDEEDAEGA
jgi:hypothetical protein